MASHDDDERQNKMLKKIRAAKNSWVMKSGEGDGFTPLPGEQTLYTSPPRTALSLDSPNAPSATGRSHPPPLHISSSTGCVYLTNKRVVYLPTQATSSFQSFTAPLLNLHDSRVNAPFFGPNVWAAIVQPVRGGGLTSQPGAAAGVELRLTFKDGGAFDFHTTFERLKERMQQAVENGTAGPAADADGVIASSVHLDELPAYEADSRAGRPTPYAAAVGGPEAHRSPHPPTTMSKAEEAGMSSPAPLPPPAPAAADQSHSGAITDHPQRSGAESGGDGAITASSTSRQLDVPAEPPPGYDEAQMDSVVEALENGRLRDRGD